MVPGRYIVRMAVWVRAVVVDMTSAGIAVFRFFFFQAEDGIRDLIVTGVQTCALPISSPEVLVRVEGEDVALRPIAGTRPRGATETQDRQIAEELVADPKERAEHVIDRKSVV